jgi:predicted porin
MNKKLLAVAIAAALAPAAAMADSGNVTIYGSVHMSVDSLNGGNNGAVPDADLYRKTNVSSNSSYIGFKGSEDLGNGLKAVWQMESLVGMGDTGAGTNVNSLTSRNSFLGLNGGFGTAILGRHDTPVKLLGRKADLFGDQIGESRNLISAGGATFDLRPDNVVAYISPTIAGFHGALAYVTNVGAGAAGPSPITAVSALGVYESGPVMVGLGYETHNMSNIGTAANSVSDDKIIRLVGGYSFGDVKLVGLYQKVKVDDANVVLDAGTNERKTWGLGAAYKMGATTIKGQYYKANDLTGCATGVDCGATGAKMIVVGADYSLSKRTTAYVAYAKTNNDSGATAGTGASYSAFGGGHGDNPGTVAGKDPSGFSLGMKHSF